jgi:hypothetical protein
LLDASWSSCRRHSPRQGGAPPQSGCDAPCGLRPPVAGSAPWTRHFRGLLCVHFRYGPMTRSPSPRWVCRRASGVRFPYILPSRSGRRQARCQFGPFPASPSIIPDSEISPVRLETKTYPQCGLPKLTGSLSGDAHPLPAPLVYPTGRWSPWSCKPRTPLSGVLASQAHCQPVFVQGSFTPGALPPFPATTSPCANPDASHRPFGVRRLIGGVLAACATHGWSSGPSRL